MTTNAAELRSKFDLQDDAEVFVRDMSLDRMPEEGSREVDLVFSSEEPVVRFFGEEVLGHKRGEVRLGRLNDGAALLFNHHPDRYIGVVERATLSDKRGRATVRFGESELGQEMLRAVQAGEIRKVSVGYVVHEMERTSDSNATGPRWRVTDWEPLEISMVTVPADPTVGIGRSQSEIRSFLKSKVKDMPEETPTPAEETRAASPAPAPEPRIDVNQVREDALRIERERIASIDKVSEKYPNTRDLAARAKAEGMASADFNALALERISAAQTDYSPPDNPNELGLTHKEAKRFSMVRALRAMANPGNRTFQEDAAFEFECSAAISANRSKSPQGMFIPHQNGGGLARYNLERAMEHSRGGVKVPMEVQRMQRDLSAGTATDGAELVSTDLLAGSFIDVLRNATVVTQAGATLLQDLVGDVAIPRKTSGAAGGWISTEGGASAQSDPQFDQVTMTPKTVGVYTEYTRQLLLQSSLDIEALIQEDLGRGLAVSIDLAALHGTGASGQPTGVENTSGINDPTNFAAVNPTFAEVIDMETLVAVDNAIMGSLSYILNATMAGALKGTKKDAGSGEFVLAGRLGQLAEMNGYGAWISNQVTAGDLFFGNWADLLIGMWGGLDLLVDPYSNSTSGTVRVVAFQSVDVAVRHPVSFSHNNDGV